jgi:hypothetical protein
VGEQPYIFISYASQDIARLKPVVTALLDEGLPLWFARPNDLDIPQSLFFGRIREGRRWKQETMSKAIAEATVFLIFASKAANESRDVNQEVGYAQSQADSRGEEDFFVPILLNPADAADAHNIIDGRHAFVTSVEDSGNHTFQVKRESGRNLLSLIDMLKRRMQQARPTPRKPVQTCSSLPFRADRFPQRDNLVDALRSRSRPLALVVHGADQQVPYRFTAVSFAAQALRQQPSYRHGPETEQIIRARLPDVDRTDAESFHRVFLYNIIGNYQGADIAEKSPLASTAALADAFCRNGATRIVASTIEDDRAGLDRLETALELWTAFWNAFPFDRASKDGVSYVVPVLEIVHPPMLRTVWSFLSRRNASDNVSQFLESAQLKQILRERNRAIAPRVLPELRNVTQACVKKWVFDDAIFMRMQDGDKAELAVSLQSMFGTGSHGLTMTEWAAKSSAILASVGLR